MAQPSGKKQYYSSENPFEKSYPYYRAVRHGNHIFVSGTTATGFKINSDNGNPVVQQVLFTGDPGKQAKYALNEGIKAIKALGGKGIADVVRVRMFVGRQEDTAGVGQAFKNMFGQTKDPEVGVAATMVIAELVNKEMLCEIEMDAMVSSPHL
jgi:enamine deaminase RidA (YjgF/YER057c/UK114 family)